MSESRPLRCSDVVQVYRTATSKVTALDGVSGSFASWAVTALAGPSGSGKSSLLRILAGMDRPSSGTVTIDGRRPTRRGFRALRRHDIAYVFQRPSDNLLPHVALSHQLGRRSGERYREALTTLGLAGKEERTPERLSGGEQQRAALAAVMASSAKIVLMDEPTAQLDRGNIDIVIEAMRSLARSGRTVVVATHDASVLRAADETWELEAGRLSHTPTSIRWSVEREASPATSQEVRYDPVLEAVGVCKNYRAGGDEVVALRDVSMAMYPGELAGLVGPSGSGKSTLLHILGGWERADRGTIWWGAERTELPPTWGTLAIVPQVLALIEDFTVLENIEWPCRLTGALGVYRPEIGSLLTSLGLDHVADRYPSEISIGEQQRASLARALVLAPPILLIDEPTGHQDVVSAQAVVTSLRDAVSAGASCLAATHDERVRRSLDHELVMAEGELSMPR